MIAHLHALHPYIPLLFMSALSLCMLWVVVSDAVRYIIPNTLNLMIVVLFLAAIFCLPVEPVYAVAAAVLMLLVGLAIFTLGVMGGGDVKLLVVLTLWTGWSIATPQFIFMTAIFGGLLVVIVLLMRFFLPGIWVKICPTRNLPRLLTAKQPVPYGIAIAAAFAWLLWTGGIPALH